MDIAEAIEKHRSRIMDIPGVIGLAAARSRDDSAGICIRVYSSGEEWPADLPEQLEGYRVEVVNEAREFRAR